ncbi:SET domain-containing protein [Venturia nashicola]|uniref:SET domain-containing protein n=1 Tax=Venturia nashicola TaxID=86259 RepID=A0A4Z1PBG0_9PEZI|nr:SET domain-containing protein [Venturia nashicola]TLD27904.1 SET domain-containing protein [Venturia nashicola]
MIRRARQSGHLTLPISSLQPWAQFNGVTFNGIKCDSIPGSGSGVVADRDLKGASEEDGSGEAPLMTIPKELVLSLERVKMFALADRDLSEVLEAMGEFGRTTRGAIMVFLLTQATIAHPDVKEARIGTRTPFVEYIKFLPSEPLPTTWSSDERYLLTHTTLLPATDAKLRSLTREFESLRSCTENIKWCADTWWNSQSPVSLEFEDWKQVDAMYRSRTLEYPGIGDAMVPCLDMANHVSGENTMALYESDGEGNALLLLREGVSVDEGREVSITYGDSKGACEMLFSYGFIDHTILERGDAKELFLHLEMMDDDPLAMAKKRINTAAPGVKLTTTHDSQGTGKVDVEWISDFIYLVILNEEDGLEFTISQLNNGDRELEVLWKGTPFSDLSLLSALLEKEELFPVFRLRAVVVVLERVREQMRNLDLVADEIRRVGFGEGTDVREGVREMAVRLHGLEREVCRMASEALAREVEVLAGMEVVKTYIEAMNEVEERQSRPCVL